MTSAYSNAPFTLDDLFKILNLASHSESKSFRSSYLLGVTESCRSFLENIGLVDVGTVNMAGECHPL